MSEEFNNFNTPSTNEPENKGMAIASMILGIVSIVCCWSWYICLPCGVIGLVLGIMFNKKNGSIGMSKAGVICSIVGMVLCVLLLIVCFALLGAVGVGLSELSSMSY